MNSVPSKVSSLHEGIQRRLVKSVAVVETPERVYPYKSTLVLLVAAVDI